MSSEASLMYIGFRENQSYIARPCFKTTENPRVGHGSAVKSTLAEEQGSVPTAHSGGSQPPDTPVPGHLTRSSEPQEHQTRMWCKYICTGKTHM